MLRKKIRSCSSGEGHSVFRQVYGENISFHFISTSLKKFVSLGSFVDIMLVMLRKKRESPPSEELNVWILSVRPRCYW